jgi:hypothetical protein
MNKRRRFFALVATLFFGLVSCQKEAPKVQEIQFTNVKNGKLTLSEGESFRVKYAVVPQELSESAVLQWKSSDEEVAKVRNGRISALCPGKTTITAQCDNAKAIISLEVNPISVTAFQLQSSVSGFVGQDLPVEVSNIEPSEASAASIDWNVTPADLADVFVEAGELYVRGRKAGTGVLTGTGEDVTKKCNLSFVQYVPVESLSLNASNPIVLGYSEVKTIQCTVSPAGASSAEVSWKVEDPNDVLADVVENGASLKITAGIKEGEATITASADGKSVSAKVRVQRPPVTGISVNLWKSRLSMVDGKNGNPSSFTFSATTLPEGTNAPITYSSSNPSVVSVSANGVVTAKGHGVAYITMKADNYSTYRKIYVHDNDKFSWVVEYLDANGKWVSGSGTKYSSSGYFTFRAYDPKSKVVNPDGKEEIHFDFININSLYDTWVNTSANTLPSQLQWAMGGTEDYEFCFQIKSGQTYAGNVTVKFTYGSTGTQIGPAITVSVSNKSSN